MHLCLPAVYYDLDLGIKVRIQDEAESGMLVNWIDKSIEPLHEWTKIQISQESECGEIIHRVVINGIRVTNGVKERSNKVHTKRSKNGRMMTNLDVFASDRLEPRIPDRGIVRGLSIQTRKDPERISNGNL